MAHTEPKRLDRRLLFRLLLHRQAPARSIDRQHEAGLTLLECLVAIIVLVLSLSIILPPLFVATASRFQNRRAEQALQVAQAEIDRIQALVERDAHVNALLPPVAGGADLTAVPAATSIATGVLKSINGSCPGASSYPPNRTTVTLSQVFPVDIDGDCQFDYFVQMFVDPQPAGAPADESGPTNKRRGFKLGIRVYSVFAKDSFAAGQAQTQEASLQMTSGEGSQRRRPLAVLYANFARSNRSGSLCEYQQATYPATGLAGTGGNNCQ